MADTHSTVVCDWPGCGKPRGSRQRLCSMHAHRRRAGANMDAPPAREATLRERLLRYTDRTGECWTWTGTKVWNGYGRVRDDDGREGAAHRLSYELHVGPIPDGAQLDHPCRNRACIRPCHLEAVRPGENYRRGRDGFGLTGLCREGIHDMSDASNIYVEPSTGGRRCHPCSIQKNRDRAARKVAS